MADDEEGFGHKWKRVIQGRMSGSHPLSEECVRALYDVIDLAPQTTSSIRKTFTSRLDLWANPVLDAATSASDFDLRKLRAEPMSVYLGVAPKDLHRLQPLLNLFFQQAIAIQTDQLPEQNPALKYQVLMVLDEFPAIGRIPILAEASGFLPGYNVRTLLIMQTPAQLRQVYGEDGSRTLLKTLAGRIYFQPKDMDDAEEISRELGFTTVKVKTHSKPVWELLERQDGPAPLGECERAEASAHAAPGSAVPRQDQRDRLHRGHPAHPLPQDPVLPRAGASQSHSKAACRTRHRAAPGRSSPASRSRRGARGAGRFEQVECSRC